MVLGLCRPDLRGNYGVAGMRRELTRGQKMWDVGQRLVRRHLELSHTDRAIESVSRESSCASKHGYICTSFHHCMQPTVDRPIIALILSEDRIILHIRPQSYCISIMSDTKPEVFASLEESHTRDGLPEPRIDVSKWWRYKNLRSLNLWMLIPLLSIFAQGYAHKVCLNRVSCS